MQCYIPSWASLVKSCNVPPPTSCLLAPQVQQNCDEDRWAAKSWINCHNDTWDPHQLPAVCPGCSPAHGPPTAVRVRLFGPGEFVRGCWELLTGSCFFFFSFSVRTGKLVASTIALSGGFQIPEYDATTGLDFIYLAPSLTWTNSCMKIQQCWSPY